MTRHLTFATLLIIAAGCHRSGVIPKADTGLTEGDTDTDSDTDTDTDTDQPPTDEDGDGWWSDEDCDDTDPEINPDAEEVIDRVDNDCDGWVDELEVCDDGVAAWQVIQEAIDDADDGGVVQVCPGTYQENLLIRGKALTVVSMEGPDETIVDGGGATTWTVTHTSGDGASVQGFTIQNGTATDYGGGFLCYGSTLELLDNVIRDCEAPAGAGLITSSCTISVVGNSFEDNIAETGGGGAYFHQSTGDVTGNLFSGNSANNGGGVYINGDAIAFSENEVRGNYAPVGEEETASGAGLFLTGDSDLTDNTFAENESEDDGGAVYVYYGNGDIIDNTVEDNICWNDGAGIYTSVSGNHIEGNVFIDNVAYDDAGGLRLYYGYATVVDNEFYGNEANDDGGGGKASHSYSNSFSQLYFEGNSAGDAGGGFELDNETSPMWDSTFIDNSAHRGGGLHNWRNEHQNNVLSDLYFEGNSAEDCGGAIQFDNMENTVQVRNVLFVDNSANDGPAICADEVWWDSDDDGESESMYPNHISVSNIISWGDSADDDGGTMYFRVSEVSLAHITAYDVSGAGSGAFLAVKGESDVAMVNSIIASTSGSEAIYVEDSEVTVSHSDLWDNDGNTDGMDDPVGSSGNIEADPDFADAASGDFELDSSSPCVDAGNPASSSDTDGSRADMGAYGGPFGSW